MNAASSPDLDPAGVPLLLIVAGLAWATLGIVWLRIKRAERKGIRNEHRAERAQVVTVSDVGGTPARGTRADHARMDRAVHGHRGSVVGGQPHRGIRGGRQLELTDDEVVALARYLDNGAPNATPAERIARANAHVLIALAADRVIFDERAGRRS